jgi:hypothetical protein
LANYCKYSGYRRPDVTIECDSMAKVVDNRTKVADSMKLLLHPTAVVLQNTTKTGGARRRWYRAALGGRWADEKRRETGEAV